MHTSNTPSPQRKIFAGSLLSTLILCSSVVAQPLTIPGNTQIYIETDQPVSGKKKHTQEGQVVRASVWRDVQIDGQVVIEAGTPVLVRVDTLKGAKIAGIKGKMSLGAYDTTAIDGSTIDLSGGYYKEGKGRIALTATLAGIVFLPLIFIKGKSADLPRGTVFDAYTKRSVTVESHLIAKPTRSVSIGSALGPQMQVEVLYDELDTSDEPEEFAFKIVTPNGADGNFYIAVVNNEKIEEPLEISSTLIESGEDISTYRGTIKIKKLGKEFKKGINTFDISTTLEGVELSQEVVLDVQI